MLPVRRACRDNRQQHRDAGPGRGIERRQAAQHAFEIARQHLPRSVTRKDTGRARHKDFLFAPHVRILAERLRESIGRHASMPALSSFASLSAEADAPI